MIVVDFDDKESDNIGSFIANKYPTLKVKTSRGIHLYYRKPKHVFIKNWVGKLTTSGVTVDYKWGKKSQGTIKQNGKLRPMGNSQLLGKWEELPMLPLEPLPCKLSQPLLNLKDGQGRNGFLFTHLLAVREMYQDVSNDQIANLAKFIESNVFASVLDRGERDKVVESVISKSVSEVKK